MRKKVNKRQMKALAVFAPIIFGIMMCCFVLTASGKCTLSLFGFSVDSLDRLYIGTSDGIHVYENGFLTRTISPKTSRTYRFTITEDDTICLSTSTYVYSMDLEGNVLEKTSDPGADIYNQLSYRMNRFISAKGDEYKVSNRLGWIKIVKNEDVTVYEIDTLSYTVKFIMTMVFVALFVLPVWIAQIKE